jgi:S-adenosylmethionine/arginine decarboxylase-like enzyme
MFRNKKSSGRHLILDVRNIKDIGTITNPILLEQLLDAICEDLQLTVIEKCKHIFNNEYINDPIATTAIYLLCESHISIHTFPEQNYCAIDLYTCKEYKNDDILVNLAKFLIEILGGDETSGVVIHNRVF